MMNGWRVFKYSRRMEKEGDEKSFCGVDLETMSQVILHSQPDSQGIKKERWLHVFTEGSKTLELILSPSMLEVRLYVVSAVRQELVILERIKLDNKWDIKTCVNKRALRYTCRERRFQIVFFSEEEVEVFGVKIGCFLRPHLDIEKTPVIERLTKAIEDGKKVRKTSKYKDKEKLIEEFLLLLFETPD
ncbi:hypothetical protein EROM_040820 [Encephalitozoon romaleae SJ-2008]|uniref:Uncharacterized protein n=1 Tax=Encephalitozoon romaleae (strain SJ-2008) TaxID=1178016 RepID=I7AE09_ENCRO|nr:hypothetical protein EROM_040820 [Encephalitozoon romaleae SJ-2008]AFN82850.1 hypothetical protein EROM_040820 [Encephalitozoon romaleae SJ-2008]